MFPQNTPQQICRENLNIIYNNHDINGGLGDINAGYCHIFSSFILSMSNPQFIQNIREFKKTFYYSQMQTLLQQPNFDTINSVDYCWELCRVVNANAPQLSALLFKLYGNDYLSPFTSLQYSNHNKRNNVMQVLKFIKQICDNTDENGKITNPNLLSKALFEFRDQNSYNYDDDSKYMMVFLSHCALIMGCGDFSKVPYRTRYNRCGKELEKLSPQQKNDINAGFDYGDSFLSIAGGNHLYVCYKDNGKYYAIGSSKGPYDNYETALQAWKTVEGKNGEPEDRTIISNDVRHTYVPLEKEDSDIGRLLALKELFCGAFDANGVDYEEHKKNMDAEHKKRGIPSLQWGILQNFFTATYKLAKENVFKKLDDFNLFFKQNVNDICFLGTEAQCIKNVKNVINNNNMNNPMGMNPQIIPPNNMKNQMGMNNMGMNMGNNVPNPMMSQQQKQFMQSPMPPPMPPPMQPPMRPPMRPPMWPPMWPPKQSEGGYNNYNNNQIIMNYKTRKNNNILVDNMISPSVQENNTISNNDINLNDLNKKNFYDNYDYKHNNIDNAQKYLFGLPCLGKKPKDINACCSMFYWPSCCDVA